MEGSSGFPHPVLEETQFPRHEGLHSRVVVNTDYQPDRNGLEDRPLDMPVRDRLGCVS